MSQQPVPDASASRLSASVKGLGLMAVAAFCAAALATAVRYTGTADDGGLHPFVITFFRCVFGLIVLVPIAARHGFEPLKTKRPFSHLVRGLANVAVMLASFTALTLIPVAKFAAINYSAPLFATVLAVLFLGERLRLRRISALLCGITGALLIVKPADGTLEPGVLLALFSAAVFGVTMILIKVLSRTESSLTITFYSTLVSLVVSFGFALPVWSWPTPAQWLGLIAVGCFASGRHLAFTQAFRIADITAVLPADFTRLLWAALLGYLAFAEVPDRWTWLGGSMIFASVLYISWREQQLKKAADAKAAG
jgi:drug/metabolite transporter (DMT)-like permease